MKKVLAVILMAVMVVSAGLLAFAAPNGFVSSPSTNSAPPIVDFTPSNGSTTITLNVVPYGDRHEMEEDLREIFEEAYQSITEAETLTELTEELKDLVEEKNIDAEKIAISDLFDIHTIGTTTESGKIEYDITLDLDMLSHFVALLHMKDGKWEVVEDAKVVGNGDHLKFSVDSLSPFAVVIEAPKAPSTGESPMLYVYAGLMIASAMALAVIFVKSRKQKI